jgi:hypothetical protein
VVNSVEAAAETSYDFVVCTTKSLPDVSPTEALLKPIIDAGQSKTFILIQVRRLSCRRASSRPEKTDMLWDLGLQNGLGIEEGLYAATRHLDATILSSVIHISTKSVPLALLHQHHRIGLTRHPSIFQPDRQPRRGPL